MRRGGEGRRQTPPSSIPSLPQGKRKVVEGGKSKRGGRKIKESQDDERLAEERKGLQVRRLASAAPQFVR